MELRSCNQLHFIQAIRAGSVEKIPNVTHGRPVLKFKNLEDIYESEDAKEHGSLSTLKPEDSFANFAFDSNMVKTENPRLPLMERDTEKGNMETSCCDTDNEEEGTDGHDSDEMTLKQLKVQCETKKRKALDPLSLSPKEDYTDWHPEEDDCDIEEPISSWKSKISMNCRGKKKQAKKCSSFPKTVVSLKSGEISTAEDSTQHSPCLPVPLTVKVEDPHTECSDITSSSGGTSHLCGKQETCDVNHDSELAAKISFTEEQSECCAVNEVCLDHLEPVESNYLRPPIGEEALDAENLRKPCQRLLVFPTSEDEEGGNTVHLFLEESSPETNFLVNHHDSDTSDHVQSNSSMHEISMQTNDLFGVQVPDMAMDSNLCCMKPESARDPCNLEDDIDESLPSNLEVDSLRMFGNRSTSWSSIHCSSPEIVLLSVDDKGVATENPPLKWISGDTARDSLSPHKSPVDSPTREEKQPPRSAPNDLESDSSEKGHQRDDAYKSLPVMNINYSSEQCHPPERLLSTRKAISPTSQAKLCQAMKGVELDGKMDHYKCKDKLQFTEDTQDDPSSAGPDTFVDVNTCIVGLECKDNLQLTADTQSDPSSAGPDTIVEVDTNLVGLGEVAKPFDAINTKQLNKKPRNDRKGSPPEAFRRNTHLSHSLPHASTGATSIQSCSERVIAFSQQQMHDIEALAKILTQELKLMKAIVEEQAHSESSSTTPLKYDVDQVKTAIKSATKAEETTKRWLSMMTRDCSRFCKLMSLNDKDEIASGNAIHKDRKKITFADEAGGVLCHVKFIEDSIDSPDSTS